MLLPHVDKLMRRGNSIPLMSGDSSNNMAYIFVAILTAATLVVALPDPRALPLASPRASAYPEPAPQNPGGEGTSKCTEDE